MRNIQRFAAFIKTMGFRIFRERFFHIQPRGLQEITERVLVFETIHAPLHGASLNRDALALRRQEAGRQFGEVSLGLGSVRAGLLLRWHLAVEGPIIHLHPEFRLERVLEVAP